MPQLEDLQPKQALFLLLKERQRRTEQRKFYGYFPDEGPLRRELYPRQLEFFASPRKERCFMAANRVGKTEAGSYEAVCHLTGLYPDWWEGRRFDHPVQAWAAGDTGKTVRDIQQEKLLGPPGAHGTGMIPGELITKTTPKAGIPDAVETIYVKHALGGESRIDLKSYDQRRESFQGTSKHFVWLDEEPDSGIYAECLTRTMDCGGIIYLTFTPLLGMSDVVLSFMPGGEVTEVPGKQLVQATWDDVPHLSEDEKSALLASLPPHQRDARSKGIPALGSGAIYPVPESEIVCDPFDIPPHWPRCYGMDVGWNKTAAVWGAWDRDSDTVYLYSEHYRGQAEPSIHADSIRARGDWIPGAIDPASRGRAQKDGDQLIAAYRDLGLDIAKADNAREAGIHRVFQRLSTGRMKVFSTLRNWLGEYRIYRRDEKGNVVKENDHLMDCTRYLEMTGLARATTQLEAEWDETYHEDTGRSAIGGY